MAFSLCLLIFLLRVAAEVRFLIVFLLSAKQVVLKENKFNHISSVTRL